MIGRVLSDRYEIVQKIGEGGMAIVYKAKCRLLNRYVAIKVLRSEFTNDEEFITKFKRESQAAASLSHPNIVNVYDVGEEDNIYYIVMEYVKGKTLKELILEKKKLSVDETIDITIQIADGLSHAHRNHIVHRDVKPHNILITEDGRAKVTDFGIARAATSATVTNTSSVIGSVHYFSPEQARGGYTDEKSDIYPLGIVMYEMLTGKLPFQGDSPISVALKHVQGNISSPKNINEAIPNNLEMIIMKCVKKDQTLRYNSAQELLTDLNRCKRLDDDIDDFVNVDDKGNSPTIIIPAVKDDEFMSRGKRKENEKQKKTNKTKNKKKNSMFLTVAAVFSAILLASVLAGGYFFLQLQDYLTVKEVPVPDVKGYQRDIAEEKITELGLKFKIQKEIYDSQYDEGYVVEQSVKPGDKRKVGYPIEVVISKGEKIVTVPSLINEAETDISIILEDNKLEVGDIQHVNSELPNGIIISQSPEPDTEVSVGSKVDFKVSKGPETSTVLMTNLVGTDIEEAKRDILSLGLVVGTIEYRNSDEYAENIVISQSIPAVSEVEENEEVNLIVSLGPEGEQTPTGEDTSENPTDNGQATEHINITLPQDREKVNLKVEKIQNGITSIVYDKDHDTSNEKVWVTVSGTGRVTYKIYFDGVERLEREVNFGEDS